MRFQARCNVPVTETLSEKTPVDASGIFLFTKSNLHEREAKNIQRSGAVGPAAW